MARSKPKTGEPSIRTVSESNEVAPSRPRPSTGKMRPQRRLTQAELDAFLEKAADLLRGGVDHSEFRGYFFALLFYKRINDVYLENVAALENELNDPELARDPRMHDFVVPDDCVWDKVARTTERELGTALNDAMRAIERANEPKFDGILANSTVDFNAQDRLPRAKLVQIVNHFGSLPLDHASVPDDLFGNAYEYLIRNFASKAADMPLAIRKCLLSAKTGRWAWLGSGDLIQLHPSWSSLWP